jgi:sugar phosphate isomerase/epimerase
MDATMPTLPAGFSIGPCQGDLAALDRALAECRAMGCDAAEIALYGEDLVANGRLREEAAARTAEVVRRHALHITVHGPLVTNFFDAPNLPLHQAVCAASLQATAALGSRIMVMHSGILRDSALHAGAVAAERDSLRRMGDVAGKLGVTLCVENLFLETDGIPWTHDAAGLAAQIAAVDHPHVRATLDVGHAYLMANALGQDYPETLRTLAPHVAHVHMQDQFGRSIGLPHFYSPGERLAYGMGDLHLPLGWGDLPFEAAMAGLNIRAGTAR